MHAQATRFMDYLEDWKANLETLSLKNFIEEAGGARHIAIFCVDLINGFCHTGPLASERVRQIISPIVTLFNKADDLGITHFVLPQDSHRPDSAEFAYFPPHCIRGSEEAHTVSELASRRFSHPLHVIPKNSIHSAVETDLDAWLDNHPQITHRIVVGDCTDLCVYHLALHLKYRAIARNQKHPVIVPMDCVDTFDIPVEAAREKGILAHPAEVFHPLFLYSMAQNGVWIVRHIE